MIFRRMDKEDFEDVTGLTLSSADFWKLDALEANPTYVCWGNDEDSMVGARGWQAPVEIEHVSDLWALDEWNELVRFYFFLERESKDCPDCEGGYSPKCEEYRRQWHGEYPYGHDNAWEYNLSQEDVDALYEAGRLPGFTKRPTADEVNKESRANPLYLDVIAQDIAIKARAEREGIEEILCPTCHGELFVYTQDFVKLGLQMWFIHPRKGASRGVRLDCIEDESELETVYAYLREAREKTLDCFSKIPEKVI